MGLQSVGSGDGRENPAGDGAIMRASILWPGLLVPRLYWGQAVLQKKAYLFL